MTIQTAHKIAVLESYGFTVGERDPRLNTDYEGAFMVVEASYHDIGDYELPTANGANGPWCVVGDDLDELVETAYDYLVGLEPPTFDEVFGAISSLGTEDLPARKFESLTVPEGIPTI